MKMKMKMKTQAIAAARSCLKELSKHYSGFKTKVWLDVWWDWEVRRGAIKVRSNSIGSGFCGEFFAPVGRTYFLHEYATTPQAAVRKIIASLEKDRDQTQRLIDAIVSGQ